MSTSGHFVINPNWRQNKSYLTHCTSRQCLRRYKYFTLSELCIVIHIRGQDQKDSHFFLKIIVSATRLLKKKGKAIPLQGWTGPESSRSFSLPDFKTIGT